MLIHIRPSTRDDERERTSVPQLRGSCFHVLRAATSAQHIQSRGPRWFQIPRKRIRIAGHGSVLSEHSLLLRPSPCRPLVASRACREARRSTARCCCTGIVQRYVWRRGSGRRSCRIRGRSQQVCRARQKWVREQGSRIWTERRVEMKTSVDKVSEQGRRHLHGRAFVARCPRSRRPVQKDALSGGGRGGEGVGGWNRLESRKCYDVTSAHQA